mmetsp:Transcript_28308/g.55673  ORF Transcript_28308/g.55673 Transcript_28308/m.55673 type:complete len:246 (+) Transcript_28308:1332-2069(+)
MVFTFAAALSRVLSMSRWFVPAEISSAVTPSAAVSLIQAGLLFNSTLTSRRSPFKAAFTISGFGLVVSPSSCVPGTVAEALAAEVAEVAETALVTAAVSAFFLAFSFFFLFFWTLFSVISLICCAFSANTPFSGGRLQRASGSKVSTFFSATSRPRSANSTVRVSIAVVGRITLFVVLTAFRWSSHGSRVAFLLVSRIWLGPEWTRWNFITIQSCLSVCSCSSLVITGTQRGRNSSKRTIPFSGR